MALNLSHNTDISIFAPEFCGCTVLNLIVVVPNIEQLNLFQDVDLVGLVQLQDHQTAIKFLPAQRLFILHTW